MRIYRVQTILLALLYLILYAAPVVAADDYISLETLYNQTAFPLLAQRTDNEPVCAVFYLKPHKFSEIDNKEILSSYVISAGHCPGRLIKRNDTSWHEFKTLATFTTENIDVLIGAISELRTNITYFEQGRFPHENETTYTAKTLMNINSPTEIQTLKFVGTDRNNQTLIFRGEVPIQKGMSGSPVISDKGELLGIVIRLYPEDELLYEVLPYNHIIKILNVVEDKTMPRH